MLRGFGFLFTTRPDEGHQGDVHVTDIVAANVEAHLPNRFEERQDLDIADRATDLGDDNVDIIVGQPLNAALDFVSDLGNDLDGLTQIVAPTFGCEYRRIDRACRGIGTPRQVLVDEPFVVAEVKVGLAAVLGHKYFAMLKRVHRARIDIDVRVKFLHRDPKATVLEQPSEGRCR